MHWKVKKTQRKNEQFCVLDRIRSTERAQHVGLAYGLHRIQQGTQSDTDVQVPKPHNTVSDLGVCVCAVCIYLAIQM